MNDRAKHAIRESRQLRDILRLHLRQRELLARERSRIVWELFSYAVKAKRELADAHGWLSAPGNT